MDITYLKNKHSPVTIDILIKKIKSQLKVINTGFWYSALDAQSKTIVIDADKQCLECQQVT